MVGIDISDRSIKIVELAGRNNSQIKTLCWSSLNENLMRRGIIQDVAQLTEAVQKAMTKCSPASVAGRDVIASIPEAQSFVRVLEVPTMSSREMNEAVQWAVRRHIPFDLERVYIDWESLSARSSLPGHTQVLVGAAQRDVVDPLLAVLDNLRLNVVALELEAQAIIRCLLPCDPQAAKEIRGVLAVDLGGTNTNVIYFDEGAMRFTANLQSGGDSFTQRIVSEHHLDARQTIEAITAGLDSTTPAVAETLRQSALDLVKKVERVVQEMTVQLPPERKVRAIVLSGGSANLSGLPAVFSEVFPGVPVHLGNPWTNLSQKKQGGLNLSPGDALHFTTAIGLALRPADDLGY